MKIHSIAAQDFLSFASLDLQLRPGTTIVTGPNGAGKSNLGAAVALPLLLLQFGLRGPHQGEDPLGVYEQAGRNGATAYTVSLGIELDQPWERELVRLFVEGAVVAAALENSNLDPTNPRNAVLRLFSELSVTADTVTSMLRGTLQVAFSARHQGLWWAAWNFHHANEPYQLILKGPTPGRLHQGHWPPWMDNLAAHFHNAVPPLGYEPGADRVPGTEVLNSFLRMEESLQTGKSEPTSIDFGLMLGSLDQTAAFMMEVPVLTNTNTVEPVSLGAFARALGLEQQAREGRIRFDFRYVLAEILRRSLVLTDNRRLPLGRHFPLADLGGPVDLRDGSGVAGELHRLKNGNADEQQRFEQVKSIFAEISGQDLHLRSLPAADAHLAIDILVGTGEHARVAQFAGAGIQEALLLATLIAGDPGRFVVLDEPAVNLHPTMQRRLARHLAEIQGIVITHSPDLIPCSSLDDLDRVVRLTPMPGGTKACTLPPQNRAKLGEWIQKLLLTDVRALLFASAVVLCEGATDMGALGWWWKDGAAGFSDPEGANIALVDVGGDNNFGGYINYLEAYQIPWAAVADGPAFWSKSGLSKQLGNLRLAPDGERPGPEDGFEVWLPYWNRSGVFTVATSFGRDPEKSGEFEAYLQRLDPQLLDTVRKEQGNSKPRVGAAFAASHPNLPEAVKELYRQIREHLDSATP